MTDPRSFHPNAATPLTDAEASAGRTPADDEVASADALPPWQIVTVTGDPTSPAAAALLRGIRHARGAR